MQLTCPHCSHVIDYSSQRPRFCSFCGQSLSVAPSSPDAEAPTMTRAPDVEGSTESQPDMANVSGRRFHAGDVIGGYRLERKLGSGAMGSVFEAEHIASGQRVALKLIAPEYAMSQAAVERFRLEGKLASTITHPRCVFVMAADEDAGQPYIVMELMTGSTLTTLVSDQGPLPVVDAIRKIIDVIDGLHEAHRLGVIHRDVKPSNCFVDAKGRVKVGDFGLAKSTEEEKDLTRSGTFVGTVMFASPEQIKRQALDIQSDVYSVCATLYYLLTGKPPFAGGDALAAATRIVTENAPSMRTLRPDIPAALDRVVLKGLDRDKGRRWSDLETLRDALVKFLPGQLSIGAIGSRFVAYLIDYIILSLILTPIDLQVGSNYQQIGPGLRVSEISWGMTENLLLHLGVYLLYFGLFEGLWGWSPGKLLMRLRVCRSDSADPPCVLRAAARIFLCFNVMNFGTWVGVAVMWLAAAFAGSGAGLFLAIIATGLLSTFGFFAGVGLLCCTMRTRNGYAGLHERLTGTRVLELARRRRRRRFASIAYHLPATRPDGLPERVGRFQVDGAIRWTGDDRALLARDPSLGRAVWITLRRHPLTDAERRRRDVARAGRLRWVASGNEADFSWDAFLAPRGAPLPAVVARTGPLPWADAGPILEQLAAELAAACDDDTVPEGAHAEQVWVDDHGRVQVTRRPLLDVDSGNVSLNDQERSLRLLRRAATCMLEGREREDGPNAIRAPIPRYASHCVNGLFPGPKQFVDPHELRDELREAADRPAEITWQRRLAHLFVLGCLMAVSLGCLFMAGAGGAVFWDLAVGTSHETSLRDGQTVTDVDGAVAAIQPDATMRLVGALRFQDDQRRLDEFRAMVERERELRETRRESRSIFLRMIMDRQQEGMNQQPFTFQHRLADARDRIDREIKFPMRAVAQGADGTQWIWLLAGPFVWICWAFAVRGALSFRLMGLELVTADGRRAARWRCLLRAALFWAPLVTLWGLSLFLDQAFWRNFDDVEFRQSHRWMLTASWVVWWIGIALLGMYFLLALRRPQRTLHDRIAGTWLMPR